MKIKDIFKVTGIPVLLSSLCCLAPIVLLLFGIGTVSFAASLSDVLYGSYKWAFRAVGLIALIFSLVYYFRKKGVCTLNQAKKRRNEIINTAIVVLLVGVAAYIIWLYVVVHYLGVWLNIWV